MRFAGGTFDTATDVAYVQTTPPAAYVEQMEAGAPGVTAVVQANHIGGESWMDTLQRVLPMLASTYQQKQFLDIQVERARQGLPPLDVNQYAPGVNVGLSSDTQRTALLIAGLAIAAVVGVALMYRPRRG